MPELTKTFTKVDRDAPAVFEFLDALLGQTCTHFWHGYGSTIFLEFGKLTECGVRRDGSRRNPRGEVTLVIDLSWRLEGKRLIWCGSKSDENQCIRFLPKLVGQKVKSVSFVGRFLEVDLAFSSGTHLVSFTTAEGNPAWDFTRQMDGGYDVLSPCLGALSLERAREPENA